MIDLKNISLQFDAKLDSIMSYDIERSELTMEYRTELEKLKNIDLSMNECLPPYSGAKFLETGKLIHPFSFNWKNRHEAMDWVDSVLSGVAVGAVDGSQIYPDKNCEIPIAMLQTSRIFNRHTDSEDYKQDTEATIITPDEFADASVYSFGDEYVNARRFSIECDNIIRLMKEHEKIYILLDGTLIVPHINFLNQNIREIYIKAIMRLLEASENTGNPVISYTDNATPGDITLMMHFFFRLKKNKLSDTRLFPLILRGWGERTAAFLCDRDDRRGDDSKSVLDNYGRFKSQIAFFYIRLGSNDRLGRVEFPVWIYEKGEVYKIADIIRAECIIRVNYPDILMRAHEAAVIRWNEHDLFYGMFENFCKVHRIKFNNSAKHFHKTINR